MMDVNSPLVSAQWLFENKDNPALIILDTSLKSPVKAKCLTEDRFIPNSLLFDWHKFSDQNSELPHMMPSVEAFTIAARALGVNNDSILVVYDTTGIYSSPRVWWMFRAMGFTNCYVLNGGLPVWLKMGYNFSNTHTQATSVGNFEANFKPQLFSNQDDVFNALKTKDKFIIDARSAERFYGRVAEPRAALRKGHMPNSINIPFEKLLLINEFRSKKEIERLFEHLGDKSSGLIFSCGSGITACIDALAATLIGYQNLSVYDGSWSEWGMESEYPVA